jgi:hypothetical protein
MHRRAEALDVTITKAMIYAEKKSDGRYHNDAWSPKLVLSGLTLKYWRVLLSSKKTGKMFIKTLTRLRQTLKDLVHVDDSMLSIPEIIAKLQAADKALKASKKNAEHLRENFLEDQAHAMTLANKMSQAAAIRTLLHREQMRKAYARLQRILKPRTGASGLSMIKVPQEDGTWKQVVDSSEIEKLLLQYNAQHYAQASETPFGKDPLTSKLGTDGTNEYSQSILAGECQLEHPDFPETQAMLDQLRRRPIPEMSSDISFDDVSRGFKRWPEKVSTSPSGRHLGHYKALQVIVDSDEMGPNLMHVHHNMLQLALLRRRPFVRWTKDVQILLEKDPGDPKITRLRIICLYEADYNLLLKLLWAHRLVRHAESHQQLGEEQGGSRPGRSAIDVALKKMFTYTYTRLTKTSLGLSDTDMTACFDRIIAPLAMIASQSQGMPADACAIHGQAIRSMRHFIKTALGVSEDHFESTDQQRLFGSGQGSGGSTTLWLVLFVAISKALEGYMVGLQFCSPNRQLSSQRNNDAYVDDTTGGVNDAIKDIADTPHQTASLLQKLAQHWEKLCFSTGARLNLKKCFFYIVSWKWEEGFATMMTNQELDTVVSLQCGYDTVPVPIKQYEVTETHKTLGTYMCPLGTMHGELQNLKLKAGKMADRFSQMQVPKWQARLAYNTMYKPSIEYSMAVTTFTLKECNAIQARPIRSILGAMGINRQFPRAAVFAPIHLGGFGLSHLHTEQCVTQITSLLGHLRQQSDVGILAQICIDTAQLIAGTTVPILLEPSAPFKYFSDPWINLLRESLAACNASIYIPTAWTPCIHRSDDIMLMELAASVTASPTQLEKFNQCRIFLKVLRLSDICNGEGTEIGLEYLSGQPKSPYQSSTLQWPRQQNPPATTWKIWKRILRKGSLADRVGPLSSRKLLKPMGPWLTEPATMDTEWPLYYDPIMDQLLEFAVPGSYWKLPRIPTNRRIHQFVERNNDPRVQEQPFLPARCVPATVISRDNGTVTVSLYHQTALRRATQRVRRTFDAIRATRLHIPASAPRNPSALPTASLPAWDKCFLRHNNRTAPICNDIDISVRSRELWIGLTSRLIGDDAYYGWSICADNSTLWTGAGPVPTGRGTTNSLQACIVGLWAAVKALRLITLEETWTTLLHVNTVTTQPSAANLIRQTTGPQRYSPRSRTRSFYDFHAILRTTLDKVSVTAHSTSIANLSGPESPAPTAQQRALIASLSALSQLINSRAVAVELQLPPSAVISASLLINGEVVLRDSRSALRTQHRLPDTQNHLYESNINWTHDTFATINWDAFSAAIMTRNLNSHTRLVKYIHGWLPVGKIMNRINAENPSACPSCRGQNETTAHIMRCRHLHRSDLHKQQVEHLATTLKDLHTAEPLRTVILAGIAGWHQNPAYEMPLPTITDPNSRLLRKAVTDQNTIGWGKLYSGYFALDFQTLHLRTGLLPNGQVLTSVTRAKWQTVIINELWDNVEAQWHLRNAALHGQDDIEHTSILRDRLHEKVRRMYAQADKISAIDRILFDRPINDVTSLPLAAIELWISQVEPTLQRCISDAEVELQQAFATMDDFLYQPHEVGE